MPVRDTSIEAKRELHDSGELSRRQEIVLDLVRRYPGSTAAELTRLAGKYDPNYVRPRLTELYNMILVDNGEKRRCDVTGVSAYTWHIVTRQLQRRLL